MLRVVDISSNQEGISPASLDCDAVIVKVSGGASYENPYWRQWADEVLASGKLLGLYHFAREHGDYNDAADEARFFLDRALEYRGRFIPVLDFEADAQSLPVSWAREWLDIVAAETGSTPWFYGYAAYLNSRDHSEIARYPLWLASYLYQYNYSWWVTEPENRWPTGSWDGMAAYQYTSTGHIAGWDGELDLSVFYGTRDDWIRMEGGNMGRKEAMVQLAIGVAEDDSHGYSQASRWPWQGSDFDCSSLMYWSAHEAGYDVPLSGYTGTMLADFTNAGFTPHRYGSVELERSDVLLAHNDGRQHTEMYVGDGKTVGAHSSETGGIYGQPGDQTGNEISVAPIWGDWDWVLRPPAEDGYEDGRTDMSMECIYQPNQDGYLVYFDGNEIHPCANEDEAESARMMYRNINGREIPEFPFGTKEAPWAARFADLVNRDSVSAKLDKMLKKLNRIEKRVAKLEGEAVE